MPVDAQTCLACGAKKSAPGDSKTRWGWILGAVFAVLGAAFVFSVGASLKTKTEISAQYKADCDIRMEDGTQAARSCDLVQLCIERNQISQKYAQIEKLEDQSKEADRLLEHAHNDTRFEREANANFKERQSIDESLRRYSKADLKRVCNINAEELGNLQEKLEFWNKQAKENAAKGIECKESPLSALPIGEPLTKNQLSVKLAGACPGARVLDGRMPNLIWSGRKYGLDVQIVSGNGGDAQYQINGLKQFEE